MNFGQFVRQLRANRKMTLRRFCQTYGHDPSNWSKMERGDLPPTEKRETLEEWAKQLGLKKASDDWYRFFDLAMLEKGKIPDDLRSDEELVAALPLFFRTLRGQKNSTDELHRIVKLLREK